MAVRDTSAEVYYKEVKPQLSTKQQVVMDVLLKCKRPVCNQELATIMGFQINQITPRVNELVKLNKVELALKHVYPVTNRKVCYWRVVVD